MGFFNSKKKVKESKEEEVDGLPHLPELPQLPNSQNQNNFGLPSLPKEMNKSSPLPQLPSSEFGNKMNQTSIKEAVKRGSMPNTKLPKLPDKKLTREMSGNERNDYNMATPKMEMGINKPRSMEMSGFPQKEEMMGSEEGFKEMTYSPKGSEPLFIKLDTFENAVSSFNEIKMRMSEIETLLGNIKETKSQEERELDDWEREIETVKSRLEQINREIFDRFG